MKNPANEWKSTACILCECNCGIEVQLGEDGHSLVRIRGDKDLPEGSFEEIDWETAIREVAERLSRVRDTHGGESIFYYGGGGQGNHLPGSYATPTRRVLASRYRSSALAQEKTGERRAFTANTIVRDPNWRRRDSDGALRINPADASSLGVETGQPVRLATERGSVVVPVEVSETMQPGHVSLLNGTGPEIFEGESPPDEPSGGIAPNTPWHEFVPARLERP
jgi:anaerobic selenocysteine-containing dehydrogenase